MKKNKFSQTPSFGKASMRLLCFSYAGGGTSVYLPWAKQLAPSIEVLAVQLPGRGDRLFDTPYTEMNILIAALSQTLRPYLNQSYAFFGHSMGALVAFELTRLLRKQKLPLPQHLFVSAHRAPQLASQRQPSHDLPDQEFIKMLHAYGGSTKQVLDNADLMSLLLPTIKADFRVLETYQFQPQQPLAIPITAIGGNKDELVTQQELQAWQQQTCGGFTQFQFPGNHFYINSSLDSLTHLIKQQLLSTEDTQEYNKDWKVPV